MVDANQQDVPALKICPDWRRTTSITEEPRIRTTTRHKTTLTRSPTFHRGGEHRPTGLVQEFHAGGRNKQQVTQLRAGVSELLR
jgi:hypothetical protein